MPKKRSKKHAPTATSETPAGGPRTATRESKAAKRLRKRRGDFEQGNLTREELARFPGDAQREYLKRELGKKYDVPPAQVRFECFDCARSALYGYGRISVSDRDLLRSFPKGTLSVL